MSTIGSRLDPLLPEGEGSHWTFCLGHLRGGKFANGKFVNFFVLPDISHAFSKKQYRTNYNFDSSRSKKKSGDTEDLQTYHRFTNLPPLK